MRNLLLLVLVAFVSLSVRAQSYPPTQKAQATSLVAEGATVHIGNGRVLSPGYVVFTGGKITAVGEGAATNLPQGAERITATGKHIYPGLMVLNNTIGLDEVGAVRATHDYAETGTATPEVLATTAYNAASDVVTTVRSNGVLMAMVTPAGNQVSGRAGLVQLDAWTADDATVVRSVGVVLTIPNRYTYNGWWAEPGVVMPNENRPAQMDALKAILHEAKSYCQVTKGSRPANERLEAFRGVFAGSETAFIRAYGAREIMEGVQLLRTLGVVKIVVLADESIDKAISFLAKEKVGVILQRIHSLPSSNDAGYDVVYTIPAKLKAAGIDFALDISGDMEPMLARNLGILAGTATGFGLTEEQAVEAITLAPARLLGVAGQMGSLEVGKDATLIVTEGPITDVRTGKVVKAFIQGRTVNLDNKQKMLYRNYAKRYGQAIKE